MSSSRSPRSIRLARAANVMLTAAATAMLAGSIPITVCAQATADPDAPARAARARRFVEDGLAVTLAACELPKACRRHAPLRVSDDLAETGGDTKIDHRRLAFDGLEIELVHAQDAPGRPTPWSVADVVEATVTTARWPVAEGVAIGMPREDVERLLGARGEPDDACVTYADVDTQNETMLCYAGGRLISLKWSRWFDG